MMRLLARYIAIALLVNAHVVLAETKKKERELPKSGVLASASVSGASSSVVSDVFGGEDIFGSELPPLTGSVSRKGESTWRFSVSNNSTDRYRVNVDLIQRNETNYNVKTTSYTYTLNPGHVEDMEVTAGFGARAAELYLRSYRNLSEEQRQREKKR
ncbi:MAG: hypothetical protein ACK5Y6_04835 [Pseudomonadota bacterium]